MAANSAAKPERRQRLTFREHDDLVLADQPVRTDLSTCTSAGDVLFTANDEFAALERLIRQEDGSYGRHQAFSLAEIFDLPDGASGEMDIEGLDIDGDDLWIVGSHSLTRKKPKPGENDPATALDRLSSIRFQANRHLLGRVPLAPDADGWLAPVRVIGREDRPTRRAAALKMGKKGGKLASLLEDDLHIGRFMGVPAKENGFDIEGIAARGDRVFLGMRGPVLRGWALLLELGLKDPGQGRLKPRKISGDGERYAKHFLDLDGLGIRELAFDGDALLILAGPTMDLDGPVVLYRWPGALDALEQKVVPAKELERVMAVPHGTGVDHAEGICWIGAPEQRELLVLYDSPAPDRLHDDGRSIDGDVFKLSAGAKGKG